MRGHKVTNIFLSLCLFVLVSWCPCVLVYAEEQDIAESFGLYSKGIDYYHQGKLYEAKDIIKSANKHLYEQWHVYGEQTTSEFLSMGPSIQKVVEELEKEIEPEEED